MNKAAYFFALEDWIKSKVGILNFDDDKLAKEMQRNSEGLVSISIG